jgi:hypothetical protein
LAAISRRSRPAASRRVNFIAAILEQPVPVIEMVLPYLELDPQPPPRTPPERKPLRHQSV